MDIAVIGGGWYGAHLAGSFAREGHRVTIFEKNSDILNQTSGHFGVRLHIGPHYPRSDETRKYCKEGFDKFRIRYPHLIIPHLYSIYALGKTDADGMGPKVDASKFESVCREAPRCKKISPEDYGYNNLFCAFNIDEPSIAVGDRLRIPFKHYLDGLGVKIEYKYHVEKIEKIVDKMQVSNGETSYNFDAVINSTGYLSFMPSPEHLPFNLTITYQPCLALVYKDNDPKILPFSFIVMDGWFPCLMPYQQKVHDDKSYDDTYIMTHAKWTIMGSYSNPKEAQETLDLIDDRFVEEKIKTQAENEMNRFWPGFKKRFSYVGWKGAVLAKPITDKEFRTALTFRRDGVIHVIPGKISNVFAVEKEVFSLVYNRNIQTKNGCDFVGDGVLSLSRNEIFEKPVSTASNTATLQTFNELTKEQTPPVTPRKTGPLSFWAPKEHVKANIEPLQRNGASMASKYHSAS